MTTALISDLHGNLTALDAVLADLQSVGAEQVICLGDIAALGPLPNETINRLRERDIKSIRGNHDPMAGGSPILADLEEWTISRLDEDNLNWLRSLPFSLVTTLEEAVDLLCVHGSPLSFNEQILAGASDEELAIAMDGQTCNVLACGHTHLQLLRRMKRCTVLGVGSVGMPFEKAFDGSQPPRIFPWAEYALIKAEADKISFELRRITYDFTLYEQAVRACGMPQPEKWLGQWIGNI